MIAHNEVNNPSPVAIFNGNVVYEIKPSTAYLNNLLMDHLVSPALRFSAVYGI